MQQRVSHLYEDIMDNKITIGFKNNNRERNRVICTVTPIRWMAV
jgi:hypothetical protein